jgi:hypothetical protein
MEAGHWKKVRRWWLKDLMTQKWDAAVREAKVLLKL